MDAASTQLLGSRVRSQKGQKALAVRLPSFHYGVKQASWTSRNVPEA